MVAAEEEEVMLPQMNREQVDLVLVLKKMVVGKVDPVVLRNTMLRVLAAVVPEVTVVMEGLKIPMVLVVVVLVEMIIMDRVQKMRIKMVVE